MINNIKNNSAIKSSIPNQNKIKAKFPDDATGRYLSGNYPKLSDEEYKTKITELAKRDVAAGKNSKLTKNGPTEEWKQLMYDYEYAASPSRKDIINNTLSSLAGKLGSMGIKANSVNIFDFIFQNSTNFGSKDIGMNFITFRNSNGEEVAHFNNDTGWAIGITKAEVERRLEFIKMWDNAIAAAHQELQNPQASTTDNRIDIGYA